MIKAIGFNQGQIGDLAMNMVLCKAFKNKYPDAKLTFGINKKYQTVAPIFFYNNLIDNIHIWDAYDNWPSINDQKFLLNNNFDIVFNPMPPHKNNEWFKNMHHIEAICLNHNLDPPDSLQITLSPWFEIYNKYQNCVALTCFSSAGPIRDIPIDFANNIIDYIHSLGLETIQLGLNSHPRLNTTYPPISRDIFEDVKIAKSCKFLLTTDTGMNWILSGYQHKVIGLYAMSSYNNEAPLSHRTPININARYLEGYNIQNISFNLIKETIKHILYE